MQPPFLYKLLFVDNEFELQSELFCSFSAEDHPFHKDFKVVHNRSKLGINLQFQLNNRSFLVNFENRLLN